MHRQRLRAMRWCLRDRRSGEHLALDHPHPVSSELFEGTITVGRPSELPQGGSHICIVGTFKQRIPCSQVITGQCFDRPLSLPPEKSWISVLGRRLLYHWSPSINVSLGQKPFCLSPILAVASRVRSHRGHDSVADSDETLPDDDSDGLEELLALPPASISRKSHGTAAHRSRRRFFSSRRGCEHPCAFEPGLEYRFHFIVKHIDLATSQLVGLPAPFDVRLDAYLQGQPLRLLCAWSPTVPPTSHVASGPQGFMPLWDIEVWSERQWEARTEAKLAVARLSPL